MSSELEPVKRWQKIDRLLDDALRLEPIKRQAFLAQACAGDEELRREVRALLAAHDQAGHFMEKPVLDVTSRGMEQESETLVGRRLGPYEILSQLGRGGMGEVYRARDTRLDRFAALKILPSEVATDAERLRRFVREAKAASALNHPNIATIYEIGESDGVHWIAMELVEGETLAERLNRTRLDVADILDIGIQAAEALEEAHSKGITHRDIKPANLMLTPKGRVKVLDFGLAKMARQEGLGTATAASETHTFPGLVMGTARYMSPEQVLGQEVDHRTDLFSFGVVLYEMVTGRQAFSGQTSTAVFDAILHEVPTSPTELNAKCPLEVERIINKALEKDRTLRFQSASEIAADMKRLKRDSEQAQQGDEVRQRKSHRFLLWGTAPLLVLMVATISFWFLRPARNVPEAPLVPVPLTTYPGLATNPSFSPDGNQVAFSWNGEKQDNYDVYIKQIGSESPRRLTSDPHPDSSPSWSPDGQFIAFARYFDAGKIGVMLIPANGGRERQLAELRLLKEPESFRVLCWHPGGKWLAAVGDQNSPEAAPAIFLLSPETGETRRLSSPPKGAGGDWDPAFAADGRRLVFTRLTDNITSELYLLQITTGLLPEGEPRQLTFGNQATVTPAWMPDGKEIIYGSGSKIHHSILWRIPVSGSGKPTFLPFSIDRAALNPAISIQSRRLAYFAYSGDFNIWRCRIARGREKPASPSRFMGSTRCQELPQYSPDGTEVAYIAYGFGSAEIWICGSDGTNPLQLTHLGGPFPESPRWSPDGRNIVFSMASEGKRDLFIVPAQGGQFRQLAQTTFDKEKPRYSRDGKWIYFDSDRSGDSQVWKMPAEGGKEVQVTRKGGTSPQESTDGKILFYLKFKNEEHAELWKMPVEGGEESRVLEEVLYVNFDVKLKGIYYASRRDRNETAFFFYDFASGKNKRIATIREPVEWGVTVSPDEQWILYTQDLAEQSDLMLVENFR